MNPPVSITDEPHWRKGNTLRRRLPESLRGWLLDESSLTQRLQSVCGGHFHVELMSLRWQRPFHDEVRVLGVPPRQSALIRQVRLWCGDRPWVFARTVIPVRTLRRAQRRLVHLGSRPLGEFLFSHPTLQRSPMEVTRIAGNHRLLAACDITDDAVWGRRSVFTLRNHPLLVSEFFLAAMPPYQQRYSHE